MAGGDGQSPAGRVLFEFTQVGQQMRVVAIDEATGIEVVLIAPLTATQPQMQQLALAKLRRRLGEKSPPPAPAPRGKFA
jgi:hypothetical protein